MALFPSLLNPLAFRLPKAHTHTHTLSLSLLSNPVQGPFPCATWGRIGMLRGMHHQGSLARASEHGRVLCTRLGAFFAGHFS